MNADFKRLRELISNHQWDGIPAYDDETEEEANKRRRGYIEGVDMCLRTFDQWCAENERHGEWLEDDYAFNRCSICSWEWDEREYKTPYCPNCGARMEE